MMDSLSPSAVKAVAITFGFVITSLIYYYFSYTSTKSPKKTPPPEAAGARPIIGHLHLLGGAQPPHKTLGKLADKHGPIFTIKLGIHRTLVISNWEMAKECLTTNDKAFASRPKILTMEILGYNYTMFGFSPYGPYWREMRKIVTLELLSNHRLEMLKHVREAEVKAAVEWLHQKWMANNKDGSNKVLVDMKAWFRDVALNVILKVIAGKRYAEYGDSSESEESGSWRGALRDFFELSGKFSVSDALPFLRWLDLGGVERGMKKSAAELDQVAQRWLEEHRQKSSVSKGSEQDFMEVMLSVLEDAKELSNRSADAINKATCLALILAATDTTAVTLTWTLSLLLNNRDVLKKAQHELDIQIGRGRQLKESDVKNLDYLQAIVKESFRLYPAVPLLLPHESIEDCTVAGYHIPAGTRLIFNVSKIHRDSQVWTDSQIFQPERFLGRDKKIDVRGQNYELIPFGSGRRMCPGITFALQVLNLTLASLLHAFEISTPSDEPVDMTESSGLSNFKLTPLEVLLSPRLPNY